MVLIDDSKFMCVPGMEVKESNNDASKMVLHYVFTIL